MTQVKGSNICFARAYAESLDPKRGFGAVVDRLSSEDQGVVRAVIPSGWYALPLQHRVFVALEEAFGDVELDVIDGFARFTAEQDLTRIHRLFLRLRNPVVVLEKVSEYWGRFYDAGTWTVERLSDTHARGALSGIPESHPVFCRFLLSYSQRMFQLAGARVGTSQHTECVLRGAPACVFEGRWMEAPRVSPHSEPPPAL